MFSRVSIRTKTTAILLLSLSISLLVTFIISTYILKEQHQKNALQQSVKVYQTVDDSFKNIKKELETISKEFSKRESSLASLNLVNNYQDKQNYKPLVFNAEKLPLANELSQAILATSANILAIYDRDFELIGFAISENGKSSWGYKSYDDGKGVINISMHHNGKDKINRVLELISEYKKDENGDGTILKIDETFAIGRIFEIKNSSDNSTTEGYIKAISFISQPFLDKISEPYSIKSGFMFENSSSVSGFEIDASKLSSLECDHHEIRHGRDEHVFDSILQSVDDYFFHCHKVPVFGSGKIIFLMGYSQTQLKQDIFNTQAILVTTLIIGVLISAPLSIKYSNKILIEPVESLTRHLKKIQNGEYEDAPKIDSKDELGELSRGIDMMQDAIMTREKELENLTIMLEERVQEIVEEIRQKDTIIHEQSKRKAMNELLVDLAHHWRQPLNACALRIQIIEDELEDFNKEAISAHIKKSIAQLQALSQTITKLTNFYETRASKPISFKEGVNLTMDLISNTLRTSGIKIQADIPDEFDLLSEADEWVEMLSAIIFNVRDAINERDLEHAELTIKCIKENSEYIITIEDNAGGINPQLLPNKLFEAYTTTHFKTRDKGLGLYIVQNIVNYRLKGSIKAENSGVGAKFTIRIPHGNT